MSGESNQQKDTEKARIPDVDFFRPSPAFGATTLSTEDWEKMGEEIRLGFHQPGELRDSPKPK